MAPECGADGEGKQACITVFVDHREKPSSVARILEKRQACVKEMQLDVADYVISDRIAIERKTVQDFLNSVIDQRLFEQMRRLSDSYEKPILVLEGSPARLYSERNMHANAIRGALSSIAIDFGIPILWTENALETAEMIYWIAYREQAGQKRQPSVRPCKKSSGLARNQEFLVAGLPNVNSKLSRRLLSHFRTPKEVFSASEERLMQVEGLGRERVRKIYDMLNREYRNIGQSQEDGKALKRNGEGNG